MPPLPVTFDLDGVRFQYNLGRCRALAINGPAWQSCLTAAVRGQGFTR